MSHNDGYGDAYYDKGQGGGGQGRSTKRTKHRGYNRPTGRASSRPQGNLYHMSEDNLSHFGEWRRDFARDVADDPETTILTEHLDGYDTTEEEPPFGGALAGGQPAGGRAAQRPGRSPTGPRRWH